jgi:hypothetical protein
MDYVSNTKPVSTNSDIKNYKGIYAGSNEYLSPATDAHFEFKDMCGRI